MTSTPALRTREQASRRRGTRRSGYDRRQGSPIALALIYVTLVVLAAVWLLPIFFSLSTSFKSPTEIAYSGFRILPAQWVVENYLALVNDTSGYPILRWFANSLVISTSHAVLTVAVVAITGYAYSRMRFPGRDALFFVLLGISLFPNVVNLIPSYEIVSKLGWVNSPLAMIVPGLAGVANVFLVRSFMAGIPRDLDEAARIDGAGDLTIFLRVIMPMIRPILIVVFLFSFTASWNDFLWPLIVFNDVEAMPITAGLQLLQNLFGFYDTLGQLMASAVLAMIPTTALFLFAQRYFISSLSLSSGIKG